MPGSTVTFAAGCGVGAGGGADAGWGVAAGLAAAEPSNGDPTGTPHTWPGWPCGGFVFGAAPLPPVAAGAGCCVATAEPGADKVGMLLSGSAICAASSVAIALPVAAASAGGVVSCLGESFLHDANARVIAMMADTILMVILKKLKVVKTSRKVSVRRFRIFQKVRLTSAPLSHSPRRIFS